jgi:hypothetical protein
LILGMIAATQRSKASSPGGGKEWIDIYSYISPMSTSLFCHHLGFCDTGPLASSSENTPGKESSQNPKSHWKCGESEDNHSLIPLQSSLISKYLLWFPMIPTLPPHPHNCHVLSLYVEELGGRYLPHQLN